MAVRTRLEEIIVSDKQNDKLLLKFAVPKGKVSNVMGVLNILQSNSEHLEIEISTSEGGITEQEYED